MGVYSPDGAFAAVSAGTLDAEFLDVANALGDCAERAIWGKMKLTGQSTC